MFGLIGLEIFEAQLQLFELLRGGAETLAQKLLDARLELLDVQRDDLLLRLGAAQLLIGIGDDLDLTQDGCVALGESRFESGNPGALIDGRRRGVRHHESIAESPFCPNQKARKTAETAR